MTPFERTLRVMYMAHPAMVGRCDGIVLVGGQLSNGMEGELAEANKHRLVVLDLRDLGEEPPTEVPR